MKRILIAYGTTEGHTRKVCEFLAQHLTESGHQVDLVDTAQLPGLLDVGSADACIIAGSLHQTKHQPSLVAFVRKHVAVLQSKPSLFLSVSLTAILKDDEHQAAARKCIGTFIQETGWIPTEELPVAGALKYTEYDFLKRMLMRMISKAEGGDVDTSKDYEYTDWNELTDFVDTFLRIHVSRLTAA